MLLNDRETIAELTSSWNGERFPDNRPKVSDEHLYILSQLTLEEIWQPLYNAGYRFQYQGGLTPLHPGKRLIGRAVTCCFMPHRPELRNLAFHTADLKGWKGDCNQWVIDSLVEGDVVVTDLYGKIYKGTFAGGNLTTAIHARTKTGGAVIWGGIRDVEQMKKIDTQVYYRGVDPTPIKDCQLISFNGPCQIGDAVCLPGDIVIGTDNGILFVPSHMIDRIIDHAYRLKVKDLFGFPRLKAGIYTTADIDAPVWSTEMLDDLVQFIQSADEAEAYRMLDWELEYRAARGEAEAVAAIHKSYDIEQ